jgi:Spy/CpxP family protein refolding chaperone
MKRILTSISILLLSAPFVFAQAPGQPSNQEGGPPPGAFGPHDGPDRGMHGPQDRGQRDGRMHDEGGPDGLDGLHVPPGTWWRNPEVVSRISLTPDQVKHIDSIFLESRVQLIHMHASLEEEQLRLEPLLAGNSFNQQAALAQISKIADTRADLEKANAKMLLEIRAVLTGDQWTKLQQHRGGPRGMGGPGGPNAPHGAGGPNGTPAPPIR